MKLSALIKPGKVHQVDHRIFEFTIQLDFHDQVKYGTVITNLINRINEYLKARSLLDYNHEIQDTKVILRFTRLDDARMFMLSFSDVLETQGFKYV